MEDSKRELMRSYFEGLPDEMSDIKEYFIPLIVKNEPINELMDYSRDRISILLNSRFLEQYDLALEHTYKKNIDEIWKCSEKEHWLIHIPKNDSRYSKYFTNNEPNEIYNEIENKVRNFDIKEEYIIGLKKYFTKYFYYDPLVKNLTGNGINIVFHDLSTVFINNNGGIDTIKLNGSEVGANIFTNGDTGNKECYLASRSFGYPSYTIDSIGLDENLNPYTIFISGKEIPIGCYVNKDGLNYVSLQTRYYTNTSCITNSDLLVDKNNNKKPYVLELKGIEYLIYELNDNHLIVSEHNNYRLNEKKYYYNPSYKKTDIINAINENKNIEELLWKTNIHGEETYIFKYREGTFNIRVGEPSLLEVEDSDEKYRMINVGQYGGGYCIDENNQLIYEEIDGITYSIGMDFQGVKDYNCPTGSLEYHQRNKN